MASSGFVILVIRPAVIVAAPDISPPKMVVINSGIELYRLIINNDQSNEVINNIDQECLKGNVHLIPILHVSWLLDIWSRKVRTCLHRQCISRFAPEKSSNTFPFKKTLHPLKSPWKHFGPQRWNRHWSLGGKSGECEGPLGFNHLWTWGVSMWWKISAFHFSPEIEFLEKAGVRVEVQFWALLTWNKTKQSQKARSLIKPSSLILNNLGFSTTIESHWQCQTFLPVAGDQIEASQILVSVINLLIQLP